MTFSYSKIQVVLINLGMSGIIMESCEYLFCEYHNSPKFSNWNIINLGTGVWVRRLDIDKDDELNSGGITKVRKIQKWFIISTHIFY